MEHSDFESQLNINEEIKSYLRETSNWTFFLSILGFIGLGFILMVGIFITAMAGSLPQESNPYAELGISFGWIGLLYLLIGLLYFFPIMYLFNFSRKMKEALKSDRMEDFSNAFSNLKSHYKFVGILTIILIVVYIIAIIGAIAIGASALGSSY